MVAGARTAALRRAPRTQLAPTPRMVDTMQAAVAAAANAALAAAEQTERKEIRAPEASKTYVSLDRSSNVLTSEGLPEVYDAKMIEKYWKGQGPALKKRWSEFLGIAVPFMTRVASIGLSSGMEGLERESGSLAREARMHMERLGPTYIKLGQMMSVRPDVLPQAAMDELQILQDNVPRFDTPTAFAIVDQELGRPMDEVFSWISDEPIASASLAQVYKATLRETGEAVAVKVQRPGVLETISKDLYVLRRAAEVYQNLMDRIAPRQRTDYTALLNEWAIGFYTELDFQNEGRNQMRLREMLAGCNVTGVLVPRIHERYSTRRLLVSEWVDGTKLSDLPSSEIAELVAVGQEAFLVQLLQLGCFHADPHPGNLLKLNEPKDGKVLALLDFGLVAQVKQEDRDTMISALIHLANKARARAHARARRRRGPAPRARARALSRRAARARSHEKRRRRVARVRGAAAQPAGTAGCALARATRLTPRRHRARPSATAPPPPLWPHPHPTRTRRLALCRITRHSLRTLCTWESCPPTRTGR